jgi:hypothetical protein
MKVMMEADNQNRFVLLNELSPVTNEPTFKQTVLWKGKGNVQMPFLVSHPPPNPSSHHKLNSTSAKFLTHLAYVPNGSTFKLAANAETMNLHARG